MTSVYIAAPWPLKTEAQRIAAVLRAQDIEVTSRWLVALSENSHENAVIDLDDIARSDVFLALNPESWADKGTGGRHFEAGFALAMDKRLVLLGMKTNVFHYLNQIRVVSTLREAIAVIKGGTDRPEYHDAECARVYPTWFPEAVCTCGNAPKILSKEEGKDLYAEGLATGIELGKKLP
jgi:nucleoside 2-deoxyribosyltransferase